jgi:hypothetical protein
VHSTKGPKVRNKIRGALRNKLHPFDVAVGNEDSRDIWIVATPRTIEELDTDSRNMEEMECI